MKDNTNPIYLTEVFGLSTAPFATWDNDPSSNLTKNLVARGVHAGLGMGSKYLKDSRVVQLVKSEYPTPMDLRTFLLKLDSTKARILASRLTPDMRDEEYTKYIRKYICKGSLLRYLLHGLFGSYSAVGNAVDAAANESMPVKDLIGSSM